MVKSRNAKMRAIEKKKGKKDNRLKDPNWGKCGCCARLKALHQKEPEEKEKKTFTARLRFWK